VSTSSSVVPGKRGKPPHPATPLPKRRRKKESLFSHRRYWKGLTLHREKGEELFLPVRCREGGEERSALAPRTARLKKWPPGPYDRGKGKDTTGEKTHSPSKKKKGLMREGHLLLCVIKILLYKKRSIMGGRSSPSSGNQGKIRKSKGREKNGKPAHCGHM